MGSNRVSLLPLAVLLVLAVDCAYCNTQQFVNRVENVPPVLDRDSRSASHRSRRSLLSQAEQKEALDTHNSRRRQEGASNMEIMTWSVSLASAASATADNCDFKHDAQGQNLYYITFSTGAGSINFTSAILAWYDEKPYFNYNTLGCQSGKQCGHYTQVVWATSREIGCGYAFCPKLNQTDATNAHFFVCDYDPPGNIEGSKPFKTGSACSNCPTGSWWCNEGLCDRSCTTISSQCGCAPICLNFGTVNGATCSCTCPRGWYGSDCNTVCKDYDSRCNPQPGSVGWTPDLCTHKDYGATVRESCPAMCNQCQVLNDNNNNNNNYSASTKPSLLSVMAVWLLSLLLNNFCSI